MSNMPPDKLFAFHMKICNTALELMQRKNADYTNSANDKNPNCFANFTRCEDMGICSTEQGFLVRITDKLSRLSTFAACGELQVKDESVQDTILDLINYAILFVAYLEPDEKQVNTLNITEKSENAFLAQEVK